MVKSLRMHATTTTHAPDPPAFDATATRLGLTSDSKVQPQTPNAELRAKVCGRCGLPRILPPTSARALTRWCLLRRRT